MKNIQNYIAEKYLIDIDSEPDKFEKFYNKWNKKCHNLSISGTFNYTTPKLTINDFNGFLDDFDEYFEVPTGNDRYDKLCQARYECYKAIRNGEINKVEKIASDNYIEKFSYGASPEAKYVFGSNLLDCAMIFATYEYIVNGKFTNRYDVINQISRFDYQYDWYKTFAKIVNMLHKTLS